jgi:hypothetical protein
MTFNEYHLLSFGFFLYYSVKVNTDRPVSHNLVGEAYNGLLFGHRMMYSKRNW